MHTWDTHHLHCDSRSNLNYTIAEFSKQNYTFWTGKNYRNNGKIICRNNDQNLKNHHYYSAWKEWLHRQCIDGKFSSSPQYSQRFAWNMIGSVFRWSIWFFRSMMLFRCRFTVSWSSSIFFSSFLMRFSKYSLKTNNQKTQDR